MNFLKANKSKIKEILFITLGVAIGSFTFSFFLNPNNINIGGTSGIGIIIKGVSGGKYEPATIILLLNCALLVLSFFTIGKDFFLKTIYGSVMYPVLMYFFDFLYEVLNKNFNGIFDTTKWFTSDPMLVYIFGALMLGYGLGVAMKHGGSSGGTEIAQKLAFKYLHIPYSLAMYVIDGIIIGIGFFFLDVDVIHLFYIIIFVFIEGFVMDSTIFSGFNKRAVYVISDKCDEIKEVILHTISRGLTGLKVIGEYSQNEKKMLMCVLSSKEYYKLRDAIEKVDDKAFFYVVRASEVRGEGFSYDSFSED